jgi:hypothetical protein
MLKQICFIFVSLVIAGVSSAQDASTSSDGAGKPSTYVVQLTEFRLNQTLDPSLSAAQILELVSKKDNNAGYEAIETIRLSTLSGMESMVQFGRRVNVTVGKTVTRGGETARNVQALDVGTIVRVTATPENGSVFLKLTYETSKLDGNGDEDTPPELTKTQISTTQLLELGQPRLVGSSTSTPTSVVVVKVTKN